MYCSKQRDKLIAELLVNTDEMMIADKDKHWQSVIYKTYYYPDFFGGHPFDYLQATKNYRRAYYHGEYIGIVRTDDKRFDVLGAYIL